jgi:predicted TIM-barrel fold metal-dependent hydrolase
MIIDIHAHVRRCPDNQDAHERDLFDDMDRNGIGVRVISALEGWETSQGNDYTADLVSRSNGRLIGCVVANPKESDCAERTLRALDLPGMAMIEMNSFEHGYYPDSEPRGAIEDILAIAEEKGTPVKVFTGIGCRSMPQQWMRHVHRHPELPFVFLHMGCFDYGYGCIDLLREADNLYLETSNQYEVQILRKAVNQVDAERLIFGSLWPSRLTRCSLDVFDMFDVDDEFRAKVFGENAARLLGLGDTA